MPIARVTRRVHFSAGHRLHNPDLSDEVLKRVGLNTQTLRLLVHESAGVVYWDGESREITLLAADGTVHVHGTAADDDFEIVGSTSAPGLAGGGW